MWLMYTFPVEWIVEIKCLPLGSPSMCRLHTDLERGEVAVDATRGTLIIVCPKIDAAPQTAPGKTHIKRQDSMSPSSSSWKIYYILSHQL